MRYRNFYNRSYQTAQVREDPGLRSRLDKILNEVLNNETRNFVNSLSDFYDKNQGLSERQLASFEKIESRFSPQEKEALANWTKTYQDEHLEDAKIIAKYYTHTGYYREIADKIVKIDNYIPNRAHFLKMLNNKYAQKVLELHRGQPRFAEQEMIQIRSNYRDEVRRAFHAARNRLCFVISNSLPIKNAVAGGKRYAVLPIGYDRVIEVEERDIMKPNKNGVTK
jgi:hypothetical protein